MSLARLILESDGSLEGKRPAAASRRGVSVEVLTREALERAVDYDDWFSREVETGLTQVDAGQTLTHDAMGDGCRDRSSPRQGERLTRIL